MVAVLFKGGDQVPNIGIELVELVGKGAMTLPAQTAGTALNVGVVGVLLIVTVMVTGIAHTNEASGKKVYVAVAVLFGAGDQVPVIATVLFDEVGKANASPVHKGPI